MTNSEAAPPFLTRTEAFDRSEYEPFYLVIGIICFTMGIAALLQVGLFTGTTNLIKWATGISALVSAVLLLSKAVWSWYTGKHLAYKIFVLLCQEKDLLGQGNILQASLDQIVMLRKVLSKHQTNMTYEQNMHLLGEVTLFEVECQVIRAKLHAEQAARLQQAFKASRHDPPWVNFTDTAKQASVSV
ncbi:MAG: hypothetical protein HQ488_00675 [Parcubacteria group bacterium]|nr:hypothetical protein [Parcubacteria group bacterium]